MFQGLTNKGKEYMAKCLAENKPVSFTKAKIGDGVIALEENPEDFIEIKSLKKEVNITEKVQNNDAVKLTIQFENTGVLDGYFLREIGIYVEDEGQEILYWYINDGSESSWLPPAAKSPVNFKFFINLMATNLESIIVNWTGKELWVDKEFLNKELDKKLNKGEVSTEYDTAKKIEDKIENLIKTKEPNITKNTAFNKDFGTSEDEVLEGAKLAETLGIPYGGILNNSNTKTEGTAYYDSTTKKTYKCIVTNTLNYADASKYEAISNNDLLAKFQNLSKNLYINYYDKKIFSAGTIYFAEKNYYLFIRGYSGGTLEISSDKNMSNILFNSGRIGGTTSIFSCLIPKGYYFRVAKASDFSCIGFEYFFK